MIPISEAIELIEQNVAAIGSEEVPIDHVVGRILAEDIVADMDLPPFDRSQMDGFAVRAADVKNAPAQLRIVGESSAGNGWHQKMHTGEAVRIMTGAPVPAGADTVQKVELTSEANFASAAAQRSEGTVTITEPIATGKNIVRQGDEVKKGEIVVRAGESVNDRMVATLAAFGYSKVNVARSPVVSVLTTGSEVVGIDESPGADQIRNSNSVMIQALAKRVGSKTRLFPSPPDDLDAIKQVISAACFEADMVVITGGVSVGKYDLTKTALRELGADIYFEKLRLKPGKPAVFARLGKTVVFGLPGNPVSAAVTFYLFVRKALLIMQKARDTSLVKGRAVSGGVLKAAKDRDTYLPAKLDTDNEAKMTVTPVKWIGSSDFIGFGKCDALAFVPAGERIEAGGLVDILFL
jgi:molybdenum cofactor synthesis domain-containing protein